MSLTTGTKMDSMELVKTSVEDAIDKFQDCPPECKRIGKCIPEERKLKISIAHTGKKHSEESKLKRSLKLKGRKVGGMKIGYKHTEETKRKIGLARKKYLSNQSIQSCL